MRRTIDAPARSTPKVGGRATARLDEETDEELRLELTRTAMSESEFVRQAIRLALGLSSVFDERSTLSNNVGDSDLGT